MIEVDFSVIIRWIKSFSLKENSIEFYILQNIKMLVYFHLVSQIYKHLILSSFVFYTVRQLGIEVPLKINSLLLYIWWKFYESSYMHIKIANGWELKAS